MKSLQQIIIFLKFKKLNKKVEIIIYLFKNIQIITLTCIYIKEIINTRNGKQY